MIKPIIRHPPPTLPIQLQLPSLYCLNKELSLEENPIYNWILQYQRMLSTSEPALAFFHSLLTDPKLLANGYNLVKQFLFAGPQNRSQTLVALLHPSVPVLTLVLNIYPTEVFASEEVAPEEKQETRQFLANLLASELLKDSGAFSVKNVELLFSFLHKIHNVEGFHQWVTLYEQTLERLVQNQCTRFGYFLLNIMKGADDRVGQFAQHIIGLAVGSQWVPNPQEHLQILYDCYRSLAILNDTDPDTIEKYVSSHIHPTISYISLNMRRSVRAMKFSLKILTLLFGDYQVPCSQELLVGVEATGGALIEQYINYLNRGCSEGANSDIQLQEEEGYSDPIQIALYQLIQLFLTLYGNETKINSELAVYLCLTVTFLNQQHCLRYVTHSDQYVSEIEDEGEVSLRNKAVYFIQEILENEKQGKKCRKMLQQYVNDVLANTNSISHFLTTYSLPSILLKLPQLYLQSALLLLYSFTEQLAQNQKQLSTILAGIVQNSVACSIEPILAVSVLNKLVKKQQGFKSDYLIFLRGMTAKYAQNIGMLMVLMRGLYSFSSEEQLAISQDGKTVPLHLVRNLLAYLSRNDSAQLESGHLIIEFLLHLLKHPHNKTTLKQLATTQTQLYLLRTYIHDGITSQLIVDLIAALSAHQTIAVVLNQVAKGHASDESLPNLLAKCIANRSLSLNEQQVLQLCRIYSKRLQIISDILVAYLQLAKPQNQQLIAVLNSNLSPRWLPHLIRYELLLNIQHSFLSCVQNITLTITSPSQLENQLVLPFTIILRNPQEALSLLAQHQLLPSFSNKLYQYAKLFKGVHLRITTLNVFSAIASIHPQWIPKTLQLFDSYGTIESSQWEDEQQDEERIINQYFSGVVNEQVEKTFKATFGELSWDSQQLNAKITHLRQMI